MTMTETIHSKSQYQHTLKKHFTCVGPGLHYGLRAIMTVMPAEENSGYRFVRRDMPEGQNEILATWHTVSDTSLCTTVANSLGMRVSTIEHLIAALYAAGVDNARMVIDGPEVPIMDGSAKPYIDLIHSVGLETQKEERRVIVIQDAVTVRENGKEASFYPSPMPWIKMEIDFGSSFIGNQKISMPYSAQNFIQELANARTFGFAEQVQALQSLGYALGGTLKNAVLVDDDHVVNKEGLRYKDEFVRHKALDAIGDIGLIGAPIIGTFSAKCSGHKLNNQLLQPFFVQVECTNRL